MPVLIGRDEQQRFLIEAVESVRAGAGQVVVVSGEAGIGKSRLVAEARLEADRRQITVLVTQCFEQDASIPYAPFEARHVLAYVLRGSLRQRLRHHEPAIPVWQVTHRGKFGLVVVGDAAAGR